MSNTFPPQVVSLPTGSNDVLATLDGLREAERVLFSFEPVAPGAITHVKCQVRNSDALAWVDYLEDEDLVATDNGEQRSWTSCESVLAALASGAPFSAAIKPGGYMQMRFVVSGTPGAQVLVEADGVIPK